MDRKRFLAACQRVLRTEDGQHLMEEMQRALSPPVIARGDATEIAVAAGKRDAFEYLVLLESGAMIDVRDE